MKKTSFWKQHFGKFLGNKDFWILVGALVLISNIIIHIVFVSSPFIQKYMEGTFVTKTQLVECLCLLEKQGVDISSISNFEYDCPSVETE